MNAKDIKKIVKNRKDFLDINILGLDISTTNFGFAVHKNQELKDFGHLDIKVIDNMVEKVTATINKIKEIFHNHYISVIVLEDRLKSAGGKTTAETLMKLAYINGCIDYYLTTTFPDARLFSIHPSTARKNAWGVGRFQDVKRDIINLCEVEYNLSFPLKRKPSINYQDHVEDICDAITLSKSFSNPILT